VFWMVGTSKTCELPWRPYLVVFDVCDVWSKKLAALDVRDFHDDSADSSLLEGRGTVFEEVWEGMGGVL